MIVRKEDKWKDFPLEESSWEPIKNLQNALQLVDEYNKAHPIRDNKTKKQKIIKLLNNKRKDKIQTSNLNAQENNAIQNNNIIEEKKSIINKDNKTILTFKIDNSLKKVIYVKVQEEKLMALVDKTNENGEMVKAYLTTEDLMKNNPYILIDFYESKIKYI